MPEPAHPVDPGPEKAEGRDFAGAVTDVLDSVQERKVAQAAVEEAQRPKGRSPALLIVTMALLFGVIALDYYLLTRPTEGLPPAEQEVDLRHIVAALVDEVEAFRSEEGRLPTPEELADEVDGEELRYRPDGEEFVIIASADGVELVYRSSDDLADWLTRRRYAPDPGGGP